MTARDCISERLTSLHSTVTSLHEITTAIMNKSSYDILAYTDLKEVLYSTFYERETNVNET